MHKNAQIKNTILQPKDERPGFVKEKQQKQYDQEHCALVAQLVRRWFCTLEVPGSKLVGAFYLHDLKNS